MSKKTAFWFEEAELPFASNGIKISILVKETLYDKVSKFGHIQVFDTVFYGKMLAIDGIVQVAERDEFIYHEMMVVLPCVQHGSPTDLLIVGGGDGGAARQALRVKSLQRIVQVEIDTTVMEVCHQYLPTISDGSLMNERIELVVGDGKQYVKESTDLFDVVVLDLTDPLPNSPAEQLFTVEFFTEIKKVLKPDGVLSVQCGSITLQPSEVTLLHQRLCEVYAAVKLHAAVVPSYQLGLFGFLLAGQQLSEEHLQAGFGNIAGNSQYLTPEIYHASKTLPSHIKELLK